jgi:hypothetical protein
MKPHLVWLASMVFAGVEVCPAIEVDIKIDGGRIKMEIDEISTDKTRAINYSGYSVYQGAIYRSIVDIPYNVLRRATLTIGDTRTELPTNGIADCFHKDCQITAANILREPISNEVERLSILFSKGGGEDFIVHWIVGAGDALLEKITDCGDTYPDWYLKRRGKETQSPNHDKTPTPKKP